MTTKIPALPVFQAPTPVMEDADLLEVVDDSDKADGVNGSSRKVTSLEIATYMKGAIAHDDLSGASGHDSHTVIDAHIDAVTGNPHGVTHAEVSTDLHTHAEIDTHIDDDPGNPHNTTAAMVSAAPLSHVSDNVHLTADERSGMTATNTPMTGLNPVATEQDMADHIPVGHPLVHAPIAHSEDVLGNPHEVAHAQLTAGIGTTSHATLDTDKGLNDTHRGEDAKHRLIVDGSISATELWSGERLTNDFGNKSSTGHGHTIYPLISNEDTLPGPGQMQLAVVAVHPGGGADDNTIYFVSP